MIRLLTLFAFLFAGPVAAQETLRLATFAPERVVHIRTVLKPWIAGLNAALAGEAEIRLHAGGALGRDGSMQWPLLVSGVHDITWFPTSYEAGRFPAVEMFDFPLLSDDPMALTIALWRLYERGLLPGFGEQKVLALSVSPPYAFHLGFEIAGMADLRGRKIRALNGAQAAIVEAFGATAIGGMSATELAESMSRNIIDGVLFNWHATRSVGIERVARTHILQPVAFAPSVVVMNRARFDALSPRARAAIEAASGEALSVAFTQSLLDEAAQAVERMRAAGHQLYQPDAGERATFRAAFDRLREDQVGGDPERQRLLDALAEVLAEIGKERALGTG